MTILHAIARTMMASYFIANGIKSLRHPESSPDEIAALDHKIMPVMRAVVPGALMDRLPSDGTALTKMCGSMQIAGGIALATGLGRRCGAAMLAGTMVPAVVAAHPLDVSSDQRDQCAAKLAMAVALTGGTLLAAQDTQGKPSLAWRARLRRQALAEDEARRSTVTKKAARSAA